VASEKLHPGPKGHALDPKRITLRIFPNGAGVPTFDHEGGVASVVRSNTGKFLVTLSEGYYKVIDCQVSFQDASDGLDLLPQLGDFNNVNHNGAQIGTAGLPTTFVVKLKNGTSNADRIAAAQTAIFVSVVFEDIARS
jgi:hypothetical protein